MEVKLFSFNRRKTKNLDILKTPSAAEQRWWVVRWQWSPLPKPRPA